MEMSVRVKVAWKLLSTVSPCAKTAAGTDICTIPLIEAVNMEINDAIVSFREQIVP